VSKSSKKGPFDMNTFVIGPEELKVATEIIEIADKLMQDQNTNLKFEHLLLWWLAMDPAEA
tara:strand:- start:363 stop:545 length:183 start_codon:yes stop_codon:yes gene_type:complete